MKSLQTSYIKQKPSETQGFWADGMKLDTAASRITLSISTASVVKGCSIACREIGEPSEAAGCVS